MVVVARPLLPVVVGGATSRRYTIVGVLALDVAYFPRVGKTRCVAVVSSLVQVELNDWTNTVSVVSLLAPTLALRALRGI